MASELVLHRRLAAIDGRLLRLGAMGGLLGGTALFFLMSGYYASQGDGFASMVNSCFAAFVFSSAGTAMSGAMSGHESMTSGHGSMSSGSEGSAMSHTSGPAMSHQSGSAMSHSSGALSGSHATSGAHNAMMGSSSLVSSHLAVGSALHVAMSALAGAAFVVALALLIRGGSRLLATPLGYVLGGMAGGALLYVIMIYGVAPVLNSTIENFTPRVPFFFAHLVFGATVGAFVYWRAGRVEASPRTASRLAPGLAT